ncbi:hypothetical protein K440DRAFT_643471 [Wilcoxina mikolae CBS 423.85]|nr:hypothetical protein K440DRAFT_643471 [Wilcoxina mikolae CBS 423.85]
MSTALDNPRPVDRSTRMRYNIAMNHFGISLRRKSSSIPASQNSFIRRISSKWLSHSFNLKYTPSRPSPKAVLREDEKICIRTIGTNRRPQKKTDQYSSFRDLPIFGGFQVHATGNMSGMESTVPVNPYLVFASMPVYGTSHLKVGGQLCGFLKYRWLRI